MKKNLFFLSIIFTFSIQLMGQSRDSARTLLKGLIGTDFQKLGLLNSRKYMNTLKINQSLPIILIYKDSGIYPITYWTSGRMAPNDIKLIEFQQVYMENAEDKMIWSGGVSVQTEDYVQEKLNGKKFVERFKQVHPDRVWINEKWEINKQKIQLNLPFTTSSYQVFVQQFDGKYLRSITEGKQLTQTTFIKIDLEDINENEVLVAYLETNNEFYISFYRK